MPLMNKSTPGPCSFLATKQAGRLSYCSVRPHLQSSPSWDDSEDLPPLSQARSLPPRPRRGPARPAAHSPAATDPE